MWLCYVQIPRIPSKSTTYWTDMQENFPPWLKGTWGVRIFERGHDHFHIALWKSECNLAREKCSAICYYYRQKYFWIPHEWLFAHHLQKVNIKWKRSWIVYSLILTCATVMKQIDVPGSSVLWRGLQKQCGYWEIPWPFASRALWVCKKRLA